MVLCLLDALFGGCDVLWGFVNASHSERMSHCHWIDVIKLAPVSDSLTFTGRGRVREGGRRKESDGLKTSEATITMAGSEAFESL